MANKKRLFRNKPYFGDLGVYTYLNENDSTSYTGSNSLPIQYDKFVGKDLSTNSIGDSLNEAIMDSNIQHHHNESVSELQNMGNTSVTINSLVIKNRKVKSGVNDCFFRFFFFSKDFFNPRTSTGWKSFSDLVDGLEGNTTGTSPDYKKAAWFYSQNGPNYGEKDEPGDFEGVQGLTIIENFDMKNYGPSAQTTGDDSVVSHGNWGNKYPDFNPRQSLRKISANTSGDLTFTTNGYYGDLTTIFQEDGAVNPIYFAIHMDGDRNPKNGPDRSRNNTFSIYEFDPRELFSDDGLSGRVQQIDWTKPVHETHSSGKKAPAWTAKDLVLTINTEGGVILSNDYEGGETGGEYRPPVEYTNSIFDVLPPIDSVVPKARLQNIDDVILNMFPNRQIIDTINPSYYDNYVNDSNDTYNMDYYMGKFANFMPISSINVSDRDGQAYYEEEEDRFRASAPNSIELEFIIARHPKPYETFCDRRGCYTQYGFTDYGDRWDYSNQIQLIDREQEGDAGLASSEYPSELFTDDKYIFYDYINSPGESRDVPIYDSVEIPHGTTKDDSNFMHLVVSWNDVDNQYENIENVLNDWPRTQVELLEKKNKNLFITKKIDDKLINNYLTPGIKIIKSIIFNYGSDFKIEPLRWKLVTTKLFLDIPISEYPDFGEVGGSDYTTIPWPYTTPVIGGVSKNSKYLTSIDATLAGGKLGDADIIDETFLVHAKENNEIGKNIEKLDLEQVRFFNESYDMNTLL